MVAFKLPSLPTGVQPTRLIAPLVALALVLAGGVALLRSGGERTLQAHFPRTVSLYEGSDVRVLGVPVGKVTDVRPNGTDVLVTMTYDEDVKVPADANAVIVAPSVVGDRYIQLTPAYTGGDVMPDHTVLGVERTNTPLELDDIYGSLDQLIVALGPEGANKKGALNDLLTTTAANFGGQGQQFHQTIQDLSTMMGTLDRNKDQFFGSARQLEQFIKTLADNDQTVRDFNQSLSGASTMLADERDELSAALSNLATSLGDVAEFVRTNKQGLGNNIKGLKRVARVLVKQRAALEETLTNAPLALSNLYMVYNPDTGTLDTNANLAKLTDQMVSDPALVLCTLVNQADDGGTLCNTLKKVLPRSGVFGAGTGSSIGQRTDPTLGGLVEAHR